MKKYDVLCPHCCGVFLETNGHYREDKPANGSMFLAKQGIVDAGWTVFPLYDSTEYMDLTCPSCSQVLVDSLGHIIRKVPIGEVEEITPQGKARKAMEALLDEYEPDLPSGLSLTVKLNAVNVEDSGANPVGHSIRTAVGTQYATAQPRKPGRQKRK